MNPSLCTSLFPELVITQHILRDEHILALRKLGLSQERIAEQVGIGHSTISRWLAASGPLETRRGSYISQLDPYLPYLFERWEAGCHTMVRLHQEIAKQGYKGSYANVRDHSIRRLPSGKKNGAASSELTQAPLPSKQAAFLFLRRQETICQLRQISPEMDLVYLLVQEFAQMLRTRTGEKLEDWLTKAVASQIPEFRSFVAGIERDKEAVNTGLTRPESNGMVEGKVHKLKLMKRMEYGCAGFALLRQRVLHAL